MSGKKGGCRRRRRMGDKEMLLQMGIDGTRYKVSLHSEQLSFCVVFLFVQFKMLPLVKTGTEKN